MVVEWWRSFNVRVELVVEMEGLSGVMEEVIYWNGVGGGRW